MKKIKLFLLVIVLTFVVACDPIYPSRIRVKKISPIGVGTSVDIEIDYPGLEGCCYVVSGWKNQNVEIIDGNDIIAVDGLTLTGLKEGKAKIKINVTTEIYEDKIAYGYEERIYSVEMTVKVVSLER